MTSDRRTLLVATRSPGKLHELRELAASLALDPITLDEAGVIKDPAEERLEQHDSFAANAVAKARYYAQVTGLPTVADDSGLAVRALNGAPGVHSRRWAGFAGTEAHVGAANNAALLGRLAGVADRTAEFVCVVAFCSEGTTVTATGAVSGWITTEPRGTGGFGYDPLFACDELHGRTFAEVPLAEKQRVSHRARAVAALRSLLHDRSPER